MVSSPSTLVGRALSADQQGPGWKPLASGVHGGLAPTAQAKMAPMGPAPAFAARHAQQAGLVLNVTCWVVPPTVPATQASHAGEAAYAAEVNDCTTGAAQTSVPPTIAPLFMRSRREMP